MGRREELKKAAADEANGDETEEARLERIKRKRQLLRESQAAEDRAHQNSQQKANGKEAEKASQTTDHKEAAVKVAAAAPAASEEDDRLERIRKARLLRKAESSTAMPESAGT